MKTKETDENRPQDGVMYSHDHSQLHIYGYLIEKLKLMKNVTGKQFAYCIDNKLTCIRLKRTNTITM